MFTPPRPPARSPATRVAIDWFDKYLLAIDRGDGVRQAFCRRELARLGIVVAHRCECSERGPS